MKISNSKKQLAKIIHENRGWYRGSNWAAQDKDGKVFYYAPKPSIGKGHEEWASWGCLIACKYRGKPLPNWHQTILSRDEYFHLYPAPDVDVGSLSAALALVTDENKHEHVDSKPTIEQLAADYSNRKDYADRKQQEADAAKADAEAKLAELVAAGKAHGLVLSVAEPELVITDWRDLQEGDEVECIRPNVSPNEYRGRIGRLIGIDEHDSGTPYLVDFGECAKIWCHEVEFVRRPAQGGANA